MTCTTVSTRDRSGRGTAIRLEKARWPNVDDDYRPDWAAVPVFDRRPRRRGGARRSRSHVLISALPHSCDLRRYLVAPNGPLGPETLAALDFSTLAKLPAEWVTEDFRRRHGDQVWRIRFKDAAPDAGAGAWLLLLLEFQSRDDPDMALRILGYVVELYRDLEAQGVVRPGTRRPPVLPVVVHNGASPWRAPVEVAELIALPEVPSQVRRDLATLQPSQRLHVVDFPVHRQAVRFIRVRESISSCPNAGDCGAPALGIRIGRKAGTPAPLPGQGAVR